MSAAEQDLAGRLVGSKIKPPTLEELDRFAVYRNESAFLNGYHAKSVSGRWPKYVRKCAYTLPEKWDDHVRCYKCDGGYVVTASPYLSNHDWTVLPVPDKWTEIPPIYNTCTRTIVLLR